KSGQLSQTHKFSEIRKNIARIKTVRNEPKLKGEA
ncbi:MAG: 50S ribosomal protein L29, partial [Gammaproteobacteria bacterium]|nr:50S ribosomal protein L29 [Gammaproteobacteria bacterium]